MNAFIKTVFAAAVAATLFSLFVAAPAQAKSRLVAASSASVPLPPRRPVELGGKPISIQETGKVQEESASAKA